MRKLVAILSLLFATLAHAATITLNSSMSAATIQSLMNGANSGDTVFFGAGTYSLNAGFTNKCGVTYTGPVTSPVWTQISLTDNGNNYTGYEPTQPTAILVESSGSATFNLTGCTTANAYTVFQYLWVQNTGFLSLGSNTNNVKVLNNWDTNLCPTSTGNGGLGTGCIGVTLQGYLGNSTTTTSNGSTDQNIYVQNNRFGDPNSCAQIFKYFSYGTKAAPLNPDKGGGCAGIQVSIGNGFHFFFDHNFFYHLEEHVHINQLQNTFNPPIATSSCNDCNITNNWSYQWKRIAIEVQPGVNKAFSGTINVLHNSICCNDFGMVSSMGISMACCTHDVNETGNGQQPADFINDNYVQNGSLNGRCAPPSGSDGSCSGPAIGIEWWGLGSTTNNDLMEGVFGHQIAAGYGDLSTGSAHWSTSLNYFCSIGSGVAFSNEEPTTGGISTAAEVPTNLTWPGSAGPPFGYGAAAATLASTCAQQTTTAPTITQTATQVTITDNGLNTGAISPTQPIAIFYTVNGSTPTVTTGTLYTGPFTPANGATVKAIGMWGQAPMPIVYPTSLSGGMGSVGWQPSGVVSQVYTGGGAPTLSSVTVSGSSTVVAGATTQLTATCHYVTPTTTTTCTTGDSYGNTATWTSSNTSSASISSPGGLVTGVAAGSTNIVASANGINSSAFPITVTSNVVAHTLSSVSLSSASGTTLTVGQTSQLTTTCMYSDGTSDNCTTTDVHNNQAHFTPSSSAVGVSSSGLLTANSAGSANVTTSVLPGPAYLGTQTANTSGQTYPGSINMLYGVTGTSASGYLPQTCFVSIPSGTYSGSWDCVLVLAPDPGSESASAACTGRYTFPASTAWAGGFLSMTMAGCPTLPANTAYWLGSIQNQAGPINEDFTSCGGTCNGSAPGYGSGTYGRGFVSGITFGTYTGMPTTVQAIGANAPQPTQYMTMTTNPVNAAPLAFTVTGTAPTLLSVSITSAGGVTTVAAGSTLQFTANCNYSDGSSTNCTSTATWASSNTAVGTINSTGLLTTLMTGSTSATTNVSATFGGKTSTPITVTVTQVILQSITVTTTGGLTTFAPGATNQLIATGTYSDGSTQNFTSAATWASSSTATGTVSSTGLYTAVGTTPPTTNVSATFAGISGQITLTTSTAPAPTLVGLKVSLANGKHVMSLGDIQTIIITCVYNDGSTTSCGRTPDQWGNVANPVSSNPAVASINTQNSVVFAASRGQTDLMTSINTVSSYPFILTVQAPNPLTSKNTHWPR